MYKMEQKSTLTNHVANFRHQEKLPIFNATQRSTNIFRLVGVVTVVNIFFVHNYFKANVLQNILDNFS